MVVFQNLVDVSQDRRWDSGCGLINGIHQDPLLFCQVSHSRVISSPIQTLKTLADGARGIVFHRKRLGFDCYLASQSCRLTDLVHLNILFGGKANIC